VQQRYDTGGDTSLGLVCHVFLIVCIGFSLYTIAFTGIAIVSIVRLVDLNPNSQSLLKIIGVFWGSIFCSFAFVLPRLFEAGRERKLQQRRAALDAFSFKNQSRQIPNLNGSTTECELQETHSKTNLNGPSLTTFAIAEGSSDMKFKSADSALFSIELSSSSDHVIGTAVGLDDSKETHVEFNHNETLTKEIFEIRCQPRLVSSANSI
jgi:hypothetical protein